MRCCACWIHSAANCLAVLICQIIWSQWWSTEFGCIIGGSNAISGSFTGLRPQVRKKGVLSESWRCKHVWLMEGMNPNLSGLKPHTWHHYEWSPTIRMYRFPTFVTGTRPIQSAARTSHGPETAIGRTGGFEWWTSLFLWAQETQDLIQCCKSANMLFQKYVDLRRL